MAATPDPPHHPPRPPPTHLQVADVVLVPGCQDQKVAVPQPEVVALAVAPLVIGVGGNLPLAAAAWPPEEGVLREEREGGGASGCREPEVKWVQAT